MTHKPDAVEIRDNRQLMKERSREVCRVCSSPDVHVDHYGNPTTKCIGYLRDERNRATAELDALRREVEVGKPKWIPIPQMPSDEGLLYLLTVLESYSMKTGIAIRKLCKDDDGEAYFPFSAGKVLAWQPLPEPYTEGNNDDR